MYGLFGTAWALMQFIFSPLLGSLSDHFGRRTVILTSCAGLADHSAFRNSRRYRNSVVSNQPASPQSGKARKTST